MNDICRKLKKAEKVNVSPAMIVGFQNCILSQSLSMAVTGKTPTLIHTP